MQAVITGQSGLEAGAGLELFIKWAKDPKNLIIFTGSHRECDGNVVIVFIFLRHILWFLVKNVRLKVVYCFQYVQLFVYYSIVWH